MHNLQLDAEEQALLESAERGEWEPIPHMQEEIQRFQRYATTSIEDEAVTIHLSAQELERLQTKAQAAGVPYQTLIVRLVQHFIAT